jgi:hypothetical protein
MSRELVSRRKGSVTEVGPGVFGARSDLASELASSTRPTKREIPAITVKHEVVAAPVARGECSGRIGKQQANEVHGEIAVLGCGTDSQ